MGYGYGMCAKPIELRVLKLAEELSYEVFLQTEGANYRGDATIKGQLRRAAVSVHSNIAEGDGRRSAKEGIRFFQIALASAEEAKSQLRLSGKLEIVHPEVALRLHEDYTGICRMLNGLINSRKKRAEELE